MSENELETAQTITLTVFESKLMRFKGGISACSLFQTEDKEATVRWLCTRFQEIVKANAWLKGSCFKDKNRRVSLSFDTSQTDAIPLIVMAKAASSLGEKSSYAEFLSACEPYIVEKAFKLYGKRDRLSKLTILHLDERRFLLMFSLSHLIGDGHTFYRIFNMLSQKEQICSLAATRKDVGKRVSDIIPKENTRYLFSPRMLFWAMRRVLFGKKMQIKSFALNDDYIQHEKSVARHGSVVPFVSTNDILSSAYAQLCQSKALIMAVNFRERISALNQDDAGNYEELLAIDEQTSESSQSLRLLISDLRGKVAKMALPQGRAKSKSKPVLITNWAGFSRPLFVEHAEELLHLPLYTSREITFDSCIVYRPHAERVSALLFMKDLEEARVLAHPLFQQPEP